MSCLDFLWKTNMCFAGLIIIVIIIIITVLMAAADELLEMDADNDWTVLDLL